MIFTEQVIHKGSALGQNSFLGAVVVIRICMTALVTSPFLFMFERLSNLTVKEMLKKNDLIGRQLYQLLFWDLRLDAEILLEILHKLLD